MLMKLLISNDL